MEHRRAVRPANEMNTRRMKKTIWAAVVATVAWGACNAQFKQNVDFVRRNASTSVTTKSTVFTATVAPDIPLKFTLFGENVDLDRLDMYERVDRELVSIIYNREKTLWCFKKANRYFPLLSQILKENGMPQDFLYLACTESLMDHNAYSPAKAAGLWQLLAATAQDYGLEVNADVDERYDPEKSTQAACRYLKAAYKKYGHWATVAASYNAGMGRISSELSKQQQSSSFNLYLNSETSRYVFRIMGYKMFLENPKRYGYRVHRKQLYQPYHYTTVEVSASIPDWSVWATKQGISYAVLRELNPWIRSNKLTVGNKTYTVRIPKQGDWSRAKRSYTVFNKNWTID